MQDKVELRGRMTDLVERLIGRDRRAIRVQPVARAPWDEEGIDA
jgi:hypothetical protein